MNLTVPEENLFGFRCHCAIGFYGDLCEKSTKSFFVRFGFNLNK